jgi:hypothetical protein
MWRSLPIQIIHHGVPKCDLFVVASAARPLRLPRYDEFGFFAVPQLDLRRAAPNALTTERHG